MSRVARGLILGASISCLLVGASFAGPTKSDGDPDRPQIAHPNRQPADSQVDGMSAKSPVAKAWTQTQVTQDNWKLILKAYLQFLRVVSL